MMKNGENNSTGTFECVAYGNDSVKITEVVET